MTQLSCDDPDVAANEGCFQYLTRYLIMIIIIIWIIIIIMIKNYNDVLKYFIYQRNWKL